MRFCPQVLLTRVLPLAALLSIASCGGSDNASVEAPRDTTPPVITLGGGSTVSHEQGTSYSDPGANATDGGVAVDVVVSGAVGAAAGTYTLTYTATDPAGNTATATRTVTVADTIAPIITVVGEASVTYPEGTTYVDAGATATDTVDGAISVTTAGSVPSSPGTYTLTYTASDSAGNSATATRTVIVRPAGNVNIVNPTLIVADNTAVSQGGTLNLVWSDEFNGAQLDPGAWFFESGDGSQYGIPGWGNGELQWYLPDSAKLSNGLLIITARNESQNGKNYTSARLNTRDRFAFRYGRIEARMRLPAGQGVWPAFWLLPQDDAYGTWAASGEIDVMEAVNLGASGGNTVHGTLHYGSQWPNNVYTGDSYVVPTDAAADFHDYVLEWDETQMRWYVDGVLYAMQNSWYSTSAAFPAPFDQTFYILLNVAVGGNWPGSPNASTVFPVTMEVDYVRVYSGAP
jgi:beta-glucanase (GH16 family)